MLTHIRLENFKSWRELDIDLAPITLLFGTNSSGKSSVLQALLLLKQTINSVDIKQHINFGGDDRDFVDLGGFQSVVFQHDASKSIGIDLMVSPSSNHSRFDFAATWKKYEEQVQLEKLKYSKGRIREYRPPAINSDDDPSYEWIYLPTIDVTRQTSDRYIYEVSGSGWYFLPEIGEEEGRVKIGEAPDGNFNLPPQIDPVQKSKLPGANYIYVSSLTGFIKRVSYLGPLRQHPRRAYVWSGTIPNTLGHAGEFTISAIVASERSGDNIVNSVAKWLKQIGLLDDFKVSALDPENRFYEPRVKIGNTINSLLDVGFGISQVLPVITLLFFVPEGSIVLLEQPELHLHPSAQAVLADLFLHVAEERNLQLIVESHSEHLLRRFQRRIAEEDAPYATPDNIKMHFCDKGQNGSTIQEVDVDRFGQISNWPENFFGDVLGDLNKMTDAALERRMKELNGG